MIKIKENQISLNDIIYYTGNPYSTNREVTKVVVKSIILDEKYNNIEINSDYNYRLHKSCNDGFYYNNDLFFSEKKANNVINNHKMLQEKQKARYKKKQEIEEKYKQQIVDDKLEEKYIDKQIMINRGEDGWIKTKVKEVYATENGIYIRPSFCGHLCKLSREGKTWKMWSELEELEEQKRKLEEKIKILKGEE